LSLYVAICRKNGKVKLYAGQTGNPNIGCNNLVTRLGKHLGYSGTDNQLRKHLKNPEQWDITVAYQQWMKYRECDGNQKRRIRAAEKILIGRLQEKFENMAGISILNNRVRLHKDEFYTPYNRSKVNELVGFVENEIA